MCEARAIRLPVASRVNDHRVHTFDPNVECLTNSSSANSHAEGSGLVCPKSRKINGLQPCLQLSLIERSGLEVLDELVDVRDQIAGKAA